MRLPNAVRNCIKTKYIFIGEHVRHIGLVNVTNQLRSVIVSINRTNPCSRSRILRFHTFTYFSFWKNENIVFSKHIIISKRPQLSLYNLRTIAEERQFIINTLV